MKEKFLSYLVSTKIVFFVIVNFDMYFEINCYVTMFM